MKATHSVRTSKQVRRAVVQSALILFCVFIGTAAAAEDHPSAGRVKIAVYNFSAASKSTLNKAEREASRILSNTGFETDWVPCRVPLTAGTEQSCVADSTLLDIRVRIVNHPQQNTFGDGFFGFAAAPVWATAFYEPALRVAKADEAHYELPLILGSTIAHEIGHLLLGPNAHSVSGIMQAEWTRGQLDQILKRQLAFTPEQASIIRSEFAIRLRLQTTSTALGEPRPTDAPSGAGGNYCCGSARSVFLRIPAAGKNGTQLANCASDFIAALAKQKRANWKSTVAIRRRC